MRDKLDIIINSHNQKFFNLYFGAPFYENFAFVFQCYLLTNFFGHGSNDDNSFLLKHEAECRYFLVFREPKGFMALRKSFSKLKLNSLVLPSIAVLLQSDC